MELLTPRLQALPEHRAGVVRSHSLQAKRDSRDDGLGSRFKSLASKPLNSWLRMKFPSPFCLMLFEPSELHAALPVATGSLPGFGEV